MDDQLAAASRIRVQVRIGVRHIVIVLSGEADLSTQDRVRTVLERVDVLPQRLIVDCTQLTFVDSHGFEPIIEAARRRRGHGSIRITGVSHPVARIVNILGIGHHFALGNPRRRS